MKKFITRVYLDGWQVEDFGAVKPNHVLVEPLKPDAETATKGGIILPGQEVGKIPGVSAFLYRVVARGQIFANGRPVGDEPEPGNPIFVSQGDEVWMAVGVEEVITLRNALVDPIHVNQRQLLIHDKHVLTVVDPRRMADVEEPVDPDAPVRGVVLVQKPATPATEAA